MPNVKTSLMLRIVYALCLAGATCMHVVLHVRHGVLLGELEGVGIPPVSRYYWSSLTLLDPLAALLMFIRPRVGLALAGGIIVSDVAHNSWIWHHLGTGPGAAYWAQVTFFIFLLATISVAWRGVPQRTDLRYEEKPEKIRCRAVVSSTMPLHR
jgi:hypothetical protein